MNTRQISCLTNCVLFCVEKTKDNFERHFQVSDTVVLKKRQI